MKLATTRILLVSLIVGIVITAVSGILVRLINSPGLVHGVGIPMAYRIQVCEGKPLVCAPWTPFSTITVMIDVVFWFVFAAIILFAIKYVKCRKKR